ncbi:MaoC domain protein dehydratase [Actinobacteria bacterium OK074]|nr:MaoC domain protein dehydratase [Actinobacteria bacterium OK074]
MVDHRLPPGTAAHVETGTRSAYPRSAPPLPRLSTSPALFPLLLRGALLSPFKRARTDGSWAPARLTLPGVRIDLAHLAAYERVCGFPTEATAAGADALPLTYPHVLAFPLALRIMAARRFPLPLLGLVHTSVEITRRRSLSAHGEYEIAVGAEELAPHRAGTAVTLRTEFRDGDGRVVWESSSTYVAKDRRGRRPDGTGKAPRAANAGPTAAPEPALPTRAEWRLAHDVGRRYARVSGDCNPIHLYPFAARLFGFPAAIAHGMWSVARCLAEQSARTGPGVRVRADFRAPLPLPSTVTYAAADDGRFELWSGGGSGEAGQAEAGRARPHLSGAMRNLDDLGDLGDLDEAARGLGGETCGPTGGTREWTSGEPSHEQKTNIP